MIIFFDRRISRAVQEPEEADGVHREFSKEAEEIEEKVKEEKVRRFGQQQ